MKSSTIYRKAAKICETHPGMRACIAISRAKNERYSEENSSNFCSLFAPSDTTTIVWGMGWADDFSVITECRILALCFMAAIAESEGD